MHMIHRIRSWKGRFAERFRRARVYFSFYVNRPFQSPHHLSKPVIISLTSYPKRFNVLHLTLRSLLAQKMKADKVVLWLYHKDVDALPKSVLRLRKEGLDIEVTEKDLKSYTKLIPSLRTYKGCYLVTADDDLYYPPDWLKVLVEGCDETKTEVVCHRAHYIRMNDNGYPLPYAEWDFDTSFDSADPYVFPTGVAGTLYPPDCFSPEVLNESSFLKLAPHADDIWFYSMFRKNRISCRKVGKRFDIKNWYGTQDDALWKNNLEKGHNDVQLQKIIDVYGKPFV